MKDKLSRIGIKWRIFASFTVFTAIMLVLLWVFQIAFLNDFYRMIKVNELNSAAQTVMQNIDSDNLEEMVGSISQEAQMCIVITDKDGNIQFSREASPYCLIHRLNAGQYRMVYELTQANGGTYFENNKGQEASAGPVEGEPQQEFWKKEGIQRKESMIRTTIVTTASGEQRLILLNSIVTPVDATVKTLQVQLLCLTGVMIILALVLALFLSRRISKPIVRMNDSARILATGNYHVSFDENGYREIAELGHTLNYAAEELSKTEKLQRELIANISHDLRTPLTLITGYTEVMRDLPGENTPENLQIIIDETKRLTSLVNDVLDLSKLQSGTQVLTVTEFSLTQNVAEILNRYDKLTDYHIFFHADRDIRICADEIKLSQVIYNLVNNALTYTGADKTVHVIQSVTDGRVRLSVADSGEGIPPEKHKDIWERYYKVDKAHRRAQVGTGLGLSIVKTILEMHGAAYGVESAEGKGSIFWFEFPVCE